MPQRQIPPGRQAIFYLGMVIGIIGFLCFISVFFTSLSGMGNFNEFQRRSDSMGRTAITGMLLMIAGGVMTSIGRMGLAGSGVKLDPEEARRDVEPWSRMTGGVVKDALDEAGISLGSQPIGKELPFDERLRRLQKLRDDHLITELEFQRIRRQILESA